MSERNDKLISVIIPVYNTEKYLRKCLDSILNSTYKELEIICINDGSTDNSLTLLNEYSKKDDRIQVFSQENQGVSVARNSGISKSTGEFLTFIDSDDWIHPKFFEIIISKMKKTDADVAMCGIQRVYEYNSNYFEKSNSYDYKLMSMDDLFQNYNAKQSMGGKVYKSSLIGGCRFVEGVKLAEDALFNLTVYSKNEKIKGILVYSNLYYYYARQNSAISLLYSGGGTLLTSIQAFFNEVENQSNCFLGRQNFVSEIYKMSLSCRYISMFEMNKKDVTSKLENIIHACDAQIKIPFKKRFIYKLLWRFPFLYRSYRIHNDKTLILWEKQKKMSIKKRAIKRNKL